MDYIQQPWKMVFPNMTQLIEYFENLAPGAIYRITCGLNIAGIEIFSNSQNAETDCNRKCVLMFILDDII